MREQRQRSGVVFYGVADLDNPQFAVCTWFLTRERALAEIEVILRDEPTWRDQLAVLRVDFSRGEQELVASR